MHGDINILSSAGLLIITAFGLVSLCARLGVPSISGYILTGLIIGPVGLDLITESGILAEIGEIGIVLLLFTLGLEFSLNKLITLKRLIFGVGAAQVVLTTAIVATAVSSLMEVPVVASVVIGGAVAMSSTALCIKVLSKEGSLGSAPGRITIAILLFQDLAAIGFLLILDAASADHDSTGFINFLVGVGVLIVLLIGARIVLQRIANWIERHGDPELAQLLALAVALGAAVTATTFGVSPSLSAFAAGMIISEGDTRNVVEREIRPFRDILVGIFFISIGTQFPASTPFSVWPDVLLWLTVLFVGKGLLIAAILRLFGEDKQVALQTSMILAHGGEFSLVLISVALTLGAVEPHLGNPLLLALGIGMLIASFIVKKASSG